MKLVQKLLLGLGMAALAFAMFLYETPSRWRAYENEFFTEERVYAAEVIEATTGASASIGDPCTLRVRVAARCQRGCSYWRSAFELRCADAVILPWSTNAEHDYSLDVVERATISLSGEDLRIDTGAGQLVLERRLSTPPLRVALTIDPTPREIRPAPCKHASFWGFAFDMNQASCFDSFIERAGEPPTGGDPGP